jgi:hypothetical protein
LLTNRNFGVWLAVVHLFSPSASKLAIFFVILNAISIVHNHHRPHLGPMDIPLLKFIPYSVRIFFIYTAS